jgi:dienelactone hydrolase
MQRSVPLGFQGVLTAAFLFSAGWASPAAAQTADCKFTNSDRCDYDPPPDGRMVDAAVLACTKRETAETTGNLHYLLSLPHGYDKAKGKWPVIVFMHGIGEVNATASDATLNALTKHSLPRIVEDPMFQYPFIVISPQINNDGWVNHAAEIGAALDRIETEFNGDPKREYLTGLSYGGVGTLAVGIALAERIAALMPVTPGGNVANWDMRSKIANKPIWFFNGMKDAEYNTNMTRSADLEASGGEPFFKYTYAFADEYKDIVPKDALTKKHVFGSYENIGHDVWHAAYGVFCPTRDAQKTVQYDWLLKQSLDGSPFIDPRNPNAGTGGSGGAGGAATGGAAGSGAASGGSGGAQGGTASGGAATGGAGSGGAPSGTAGTGAASGGTAGTGTAPVGAAGASTSNDSGGCSVAPASVRSKAGASWLLLAAAGLAAAVIRPARARARRARARGRSSSAR